MSHRLICPHCRGVWTPRSRTESASLVCPDCRAVPAMATFVSAKSRPIARKRRTWPAIAVICVAILIAIAAAGSGILYVLNRSPGPNQAVAIESTAFPQVQPESVCEVISLEPEIPKASGPAPNKLAECEVEAAPAPRLEVPPIVKPKPAIVVAAKPSPKADRPAATPPFKRMRPAPSADELLHQLYQVREIELEKQFRNNVSRDLLVFAAIHRGELPRPTLPIFDRKDLAGMPVRMGMDCHLGKESAEALQVLSRKLRTYMSESVAANANNAGVKDPRPDVDFVRGKLKTDGESTWAVSDAVPALVQILQGEDRPLRLLLVEMLARVKCREATRALAQRAMFDLAADVREAAVTALKGRPSDEVRETLLAGLRYPWPAAAEFAAEALVNIGAKSAIPHLAKLLDEPDPAAPCRAGKGSHANFYVREVVRVNHLRNCMMCHSPSLAQSDLVRAPVPNQGQPLPPSFTPAYYEAPPSLGTMFVRADVTYLKQDFAAPQAVAVHGPWPEHQRYDYFVRLKAASAIEKLSKSKAHASYPQKNAVRFALRELTGKDFGDSTADWKAYLQTMNEN